MVFRKIVWVLGLILSPVYLHSQCNTPNPPAGLVCDPSLPNGAPLLCELDCLDGYTGMMPPYDEMASQDDQPSPLCETLNGGQPNNMSWFAFIAGSETIRFRITPFDCSGGQSANGVQAGIYGDCEGIEKIYCESEAQENAFEMGGPGFIPGQVYYFFIDGFEGSQCMYMVDVLEGQQPFPLPSFTFNSDDYQKGETLCTGGSISTIVRGLGEEDVTYAYTVDPPTEQFPGGIHTETGDSLVNWTFSESGTYQVCVSVSNGCDVSSGHCITVETELLNNEVFSEVSICLEDLNNYEGPDVEDPNGDGVMGWQGSTKFFPGINRDTILTSEGCLYTQEINVVLIEPERREDVTLFTCPGSFPIIYEGESYDMPFSDVNVTLDDRSFTGCDSLISLTIQEVLIDAAVSIERCDAGQAVLEVRILDQVPGALDSLYVVWFDSSGLMLSNPQEETYEWTVSDPGEYEIQITGFIDGNECTFIFNSERVDFDALRPPPPIMIDWLTEPCEDRSSVMYNVEELTEPNVTYTWTYPTDVASVNDNNSETIEIEWGNSTGGEVCVSVTNSCGTSLPSCDTITIVPIPVGSINLDMVSCVGDTVSISSDGQDSWLYNWDFADGIVVSSSDPNGSGPHDIVFNQSGLKSIELSITNGDCTSPLIVQELNVTPILNAPVIECTSTDETIIFTWDEVAGAVGYDINIVSGQSPIIDERRVEFTGLTLGEIAEIEVSALSDFDCAHSLIVSESCSANCDDIGFSIITPIDSVCINRSEPIELEFMSSLNDLVVNWEGGVYIDEFGNFFPFTANPGFNQVIAWTERGGCRYSDTIEIFVAELPDWNYEVVYPFCDLTQEAWIIVNPPPSEAPFNYFLNGDLVSEDTMVVNFGTPLLQAINATGCETAEAIGVNGPDMYQFILNLPTTIKTGESIEITSSNDVDEGFTLNNLEVFATVDGTLCETTEITECEFIQWSPSTSQTVCIEVNYNAGCMTRNCFDITVLEVINVFIPNVFSPNQDGNNDRWTINSSISGLILDQLSVFDRWGNLIFNRSNVLLEDTNNQWDGHYNGTLVPSGVYLYVLKYDDEDGDEITETGSLTVIR